MPLFIRLSLKGEGDTLMIKETTVSIRNICFAYETKQILKHISMEIQKGRICFVMGNNGSGKTTLLKNITGFLSPQFGSVLINNIDVSKIDKNTLSKKISYVPQAIHLNTDFSVIDYLSLGRTPYLGVLDKMSKEDYQIIEKYSTRLSIDDLYDVPFNKLSGGQKQLVAIARSLIQETPIIVLDEPMSALDIGKQAELLKYLNELAKNGKTIILTTHNPNHTFVVDSDACFVKEGEIVAFGNSKSIINEGLLKEIYGNGVELDKNEKHTSIVFNKDNIIQ